MPDDDTPIYDEVRDRLLFDPSPPPAEQAPASSTWFTPPPPQGQGAGEWAWPTPGQAPTPFGSTDHLVERTDNSLRPDDLQLEQPPQDPNWRPS